MSSILQQADRPVEWTAGLISLDESPIVMAQYDRYTRWNGWLCPRIDALSVERVMAWAAEPYIHAWREDGVLVVTHTEYRDEALEKGWDYEDDIYEADEDGLYSLGAFSWVWSEWSERAGDLEVGERFTVNGEEWLTCVANRREAGVVARVEGGDEPLVTLGEDDVVCTVAYAKGLVSA